MKVAAIVAVTLALALAFAAGYPAFAVEQTKSAAESSPAAPAHEMPGPVMMHGRGMMGHPGMMHGRGMMSPGHPCMGEMGMGGPMGMGMMSDPKTRGEMMQIRGRMLKQMGELMEKRGKEIEAGKK